MNLANYTKALEIAEADAVAFKKAMVVVYRSESDEFVRFNLDVHTKYEHPGFHEMIVASIDHEGIITESAWMKIQLEKVAA